MTSRLPFDEDDVGFIFDDLHRGRSVLPPHPVPTRPALVRWDFQQPLSLENCVVMEVPEADRHVKECWGESGKRPEEVWGEDVARIVARRTLEIVKLKEWIL